MTLSSEAIQEEEMAFNGEDNQYDGQDYYEE